MAIYILGNILLTACSLGGGFVYFFVNKYFVFEWCEFCESFSRCINLFYIYRKIIQKIIMECYTCGKKYKSWNGLFYHKKKVRFI